MNVKFWQILCFLGVIIGATIAAFPSEKRMLALLIDNGRYGQARTIVDDLMKKNQDDADLLREAVRLDLLQGAPDEAIGRLERLNRLSPPVAESLMELARLYEWTRNPAKAQAAWEAVLKLAPEDETALIRLIDYYQYNDDQQKEAAVVVRLIRQQRLTGQWQAGGNQLTDLIGTELEKLGQDAEKSPSDPLGAILIISLYQLYRQLLNDRGDEAATHDDPATPLITRCLEQFVWTGHPSQGEHFARQIDRRWHTGIDQQMVLVDVLRWNEMNREALDLLQRLHEQVPADRGLLVAMAATAAAANDPQSGISAYQALIRLNPGVPAYRHQLMALYRQAGRIEAIFDDYQRQFEYTADVRFVDQMMALAMESGDDRMREAALALAAGVDTEGPLLLEQRAELYLALNRPEAAYPLLKRIAAAPQSDAQDQLTMIQVAGYTNDPAVMADALTVAEARMPDNPERLKLIAEHWLAMARPEKAYATMRRLTSISGNHLTNILRTLEMAGHSGGAHLISEAIVWATALAPDEPAVSERSVALYLAIGQNEQAYGLKAMWVRQQRALGQVPSLMALAESTGRPDFMEDALETALTLMPDDAGLHLRLARLHLAQGQAPQAIDAFEHYLHLRPDDRASQVQLATLYEWEHQPENALSIYRRLARAHPNDATVSHALTRLMAETGDREGLLRRLMQQADADTTNADRALAAGRALVAENRLETGLLYLEGAAALIPARMDVWQDLANVYEWTGRVDRLITALEHLAKAGLLDERQSILLAQRYLDTNRSADALPLLQAVEKQSRLPHREGLMLAEAYEITHRPEAALRLYQRFLNENRKDTVFLADLGGRALWRKRTDLALTIYQAVLQKDPKNLQALKGAGQAYAWNNEPLRAIAALEAYNRIRPDDYETQYLLGELYDITHREGDARKHYRKAMKLINSKKVQVATTGKKVPGGRTQP